MLYNTSVTPKMRRFFAHGFRPEKAGEPSQLYWFDLKLKKGEAPKLVPHLIDDQSGVGAQFVTEDFNGDGKVDIAISNRKGVFLFLESMWQILKKDSF